MRGAVDEMRQVVADAAEARDLPRQPGAVRRTTPAISRPAEQRGARGRRSRTSYATLALAFAQLGQGQLDRGDRHVPEARDHRRAGRVLRGVRPRRPGRATRAGISEAVTILEQGAAADLAAEERRQGRGEARRAGVRAAAARTDARRRSRPPRRRWQHSKAVQDPVPGGAHLRRGRADATRRGRSIDGPRRRAAGRAAGLREDPRGRDRARRRATPRAGDQGC